MVAYHHDAHAEAPKRRRKRPPPNVARGALRRRVVGRLPRTGKSTALRAIVRAACADERVDLASLHLLREGLSPQACDNDNWVVLARTVSLAVLLDALQVACQTAGVCAGPATAFAVAHLLQIYEHTQLVEAREREAREDDEAHRQRHRQALLAAWADA
jgi:hypothetical protein